MEDEVWEVGWSMKDEVWEVGWSMEDEVWKSIGNEYERNK